MKFFTGLVTTVLCICLGIFGINYLVRNYSFDMAFAGNAISASKVEAEEILPATSTPIEEPVAPPKDIHLPTPEHVRGLYVSSYSFMDKSFQKRLDTMIDNTTINAIVVDIKDAPGTVLFDIGLDVPCVNPLMDMAKLEERLDYYQQKGIYTIARVAVFRDACYVKQHPELAVMNVSGAAWRDNGGHYWLSPHEMQTKEYIRDMARAVYDRGFDEVQFDYVRYPSDGKMGALAYEYVEGAGKGLATSTTASKVNEAKRRATLKSFFQYMRTELAGIPLSADVFGMVLTNNDDLSIGQHMDDIAPYVDYISGMIYPSHFGKQWNGISNTHTNPYQTVYDSSKMGLEKLVKNNISSSTARQMSRPWLQDFSIYGVVYNAPEVKAQIKALADLGIYNFLLWNASNRYTAGVLDK
ncbi:MAG: putative glycoside hydrolase [Patescibacteria group bacterium]